MKPEDPASKISTTPNAATGADEFRTHVDTLIESFSSKRGLDDEATRELRELVDAAIDENIAEQVDSRLGRVLASALEHL